MISSQYESTTINPIVSTTIMSHYESHGSQFFRLVIPCLLLGCWSIKSFAPPWQRPGDDLMSTGGLTIWNLWRHVLFFGWIKGEMFFKPKFVEVKTHNYTTSKISMFCDVVEVTYATNIPRCFFPGGTLTSTWLKISWNLVTKSYVASLL